MIIGDTPADVACGASLGARAVAVATGGYTVEQLTACGPYATFGDLTDTGTGLGTPSRTEKMVGRPRSRCGDGRVAGMLRAGLDCVVIRGNY